MDRDAIIEFLKSSKLLKKDKNRPEYCIPDTSENKAFLESLKQTSLIDDDYNPKYEKGFIKYRILKVHFFRETKIHYFIDEKEFIETCNTEGYEKSFYIESLKVYYDKFDDIEQLKSIIFFKIYTLLVLIKKILEEICDYKEDSGNLIKYILFYQGNIEIINKIEYDKIEKKKDIGFERKEKLIKKILSELNENSSEGINKNFLKKSIKDNFFIEIKNREKISISKILEKIENIYEDYELLKKAYIDTLKPEKIKENFRKKHNEIINSINNTLSDLHTKALFIPLAIIFTIAQKSENLSVSSHNVLIFISIEIFLFLLLFFTKGHSVILNSIKLQIESLKEEFKNNEALNEFKDKLSNIEMSYRAVCNRIKVVYVSIILSMLLAAYINKDSLKIFIKFLKSYFIK